MSRIVLRRTFRIATPISIFFLLTSSFFLPAPASAQVTDPACWHQTTALECGRLNGYFDPGELEEGKSAACETGWFRCYAGMKPIELGVRLGTVESVPDLGAYLRLAYRWAVPVAAMLATVVIMVAGLLWITSAGAGQKDTAKQWISNAIIGLLLALGSYVILRTINPDLVTLQLPRSYIVRQIPAGAFWCRNMEAATMFSFDLPTNSQDYKLGPDNLPCGLQYYASSDRGSQRCRGDVCPDKKICIVFEGGQQYGCVAAQLAGSITGKGVDNDVDLHAVCTDGEEFQVLDVNAKGEPGNTQPYQIALASADVTNAVRRCGGEDKLAGFYLRLEVNDPNAEDDWYAVGVNACGASARPFEVTVDGYPTTDPTVFTKEMWRLQVVDAHRSDWLFSPAIFRGQGTRCELSITEDTFPSRSASAAGSPSRPGEVLERDFVN